MSKHELMPGVDSSCHVRTNVSLRMDIIWGINVRSIHNGEVLPFSIMYIQKGYQEFEVKVDEQRGALRFVEKHDNVFLSLFVVKFF